MNLFRKNIDSNIKLSSIVLLLIVSLLIHSNIALCQTAESQLDPTSILSFDLTEKPQIETEGRNKTEELYAASVRIRKTPHELPRGLQPLNGFWAVNLSQTNDVFQSETEQPDTQNRQEITEKELIREKFAAVVESKTSSKKDLLQGLIRQIGSIEIKQEQDAGAAEQKTSETAPQQPTETINKENIKEETTQNENKIKEKTPAPVLLAKIQLLKNKPELVKQPFMLAELLYLNGYEEDAAYFYNIALNLQDKTEKSDDSDRSWLLFQKANCQRLFAPQQAVETYKQLIWEYPNSLWIERAQASLELLEFYLGEEPEKIIESCRKQLDDPNYFYGAAQE